MPDQIIYKVLRQEEWRAFQACDEYLGSADDERDGFIHFSTSRQLPGTLKKYFSGEAGLKLIAFRAAPLGNALKWERSRDGDLFPHLYAALPRTVHENVWELAVEDGTHLLPPEIMEAGE